MVMEHENMLPCCSCWPSGFRVVLKCKKKKLPCTWGGMFFENTGSHLPDDMFLITDGLQC